MASCRDSQFSLELEVTVVMRRVHVVPSPTVRFFRKHLSAGISSTMAFSRLQEQDAALKCGDVDQLDISPSLARTRHARVIFLLDQMEIAHGPVGYVRVGILYRP